MKDRILVVDDDDVFCEYVEGLLQNRYEIATASNGEEALDRASQVIPDLVLLDLVPTLRM